MKKIHKHSLTLSMLVLVLAIAGYAFLGGLNATGNLIGTPAEEFPHWDANVIQYRFENRSECGPYQASRIEWALETITNETNRSITFLENPQGTLVFVCNRGFDRGVSGMAIQGEANYRTTPENVITSAEVYFSNSGPRTYSGGCRAYPDLEIHEILHVFGFEHIDDKMSIMYWQAQSCRFDRLRIDPEIVQKLQEIYVR